MKRGKKNHHWIQKTACGLFAAVFLLSASITAPAYGADTTQWEQQKDALQQRIDEANQKIASLSAEKKNTEEYMSALAEKIGAVQQQIDALEKEIQAIQSQIDMLEAQIKEKEVQIQQLEAQIKEQQDQFNEKKDQYMQRVKILYMCGNVTNLEALLTSDDISTLLTRAQLIHSVSKKDQAALNELVQEMTEIQEKQSELEESRKILQDSKTDLLTSKSKQDDALRAVETQKAQLDADKKANQQAVESYQKQMIDQGNIIKTSRQEQDEVDREIAEAIANAEKNQNNGNNGGNSSGESGNNGSGGNSESGGSENGGSGEESGGNSGGESGGDSDGFDYSYIGTGVYKGRFVHPCPDRKEISVGYPNYSDGDYHGGVDFACWQTKPPIYAADTGSVILVGDKGNKSYGKYLVIRHESGLYTLYAHCSEIYVQDGQKVNRGQHIAKVGSTGNSSGPHLHFEIRLGDGNSHSNTANPSKYVKDALFWF